MVPQSGSSALDFYPSFTTLNWVCSCWTAWAFISTNHEREEKPGPKSKIKLKNSKYLCVNYDAHLYSSSQQLGARAHSGQFPRRPIQFLQKQFWNQSNISDTQIKSMIAYKECPHNRFKLYLSVIIQLEMLLNVVNSNSYASNATEQINYSMMLTGLKWPRFAFWELGS